MLSRVAKVGLRRPVSFTLVRAFSSAAEKQEFKYLTYEQKGATVWITYVR